MKQLCRQLSSSMYGILDWYDIQDMSMYHTPELVGFYLHNEHVLKTYLVLHWTRIALTGGRTDNCVTYLQFPIQIRFAADRAFVSPRDVHA